jgi:hypothetical protein
VTVIASAAKQSRAVHAEGLDCFVASASRNDADYRQTLNSNRRIKLADEHHRQNGREQRQQSFVPWAHN